MTLPIHVLPDGRRVVSSVQVALALDVRHDNLLRAIHRVMDLWPQTDAFVAGVYRDSTNRRCEQYWLGAPALFLLTDMMIGRPARCFRAHLGGWCRMLIRGAMPVVRLSAPQRRRKASSASAAAPTAVSGETFEFLSWLMAEYGRRVGTDHAA